MRQARVPHPPPKKILIIIHPLHLRHLFRKKDEDNKCSVTEMPSGGFEIPRKQRKLFHEMRSEMNQIAQKRV